MAGQTVGDPRSPEPKAEGVTKKGSSPGQWVRPREGYRRASMDRLEGNKDKLGEALKMKDLEAGTLQ